MLQSVFFCEIIYSNLISDNPIKKIKELLVDVILYSFKHLNINDNVILINDTAYGMFSFIRRM